MIMRSILTTLAGLSMSTCLLAQEPASETLLSGLTNPSGVAVQPETGIVFVADSGTGRVVRVVEGKAEVVIQGFPLDSYGKEPSYAVGPLGLTFLDKDRLVVGGGGLPDGEELLRVYKLPAEGTIEASEMLAGLALPALLTGCGGDDNPASTPAPVAAAYTSATFSAMAAPTLDNAAAMATTTVGSTLSVSFSDGSFIVSASPQLGTSVAGAVAGATNSFSMGSFQQLMPYLLLAGVAWIVIKHRRP